MSDTDPVYDCIDCDDAVAPEDYCRDCRRCRWCCGCRYAGAWQDAEGIETRWGVVFPVAGV